MPPSRLLWIGAVLGVSFGSWNLYETWATPLADDSLPALLAFYGPMFLAWGVAGFWQGRRTRSLGQSSAAGAAIAFGAFTSYSALVLVRVNLFLDQLRGRDDWQSLIARFATSGFDDFRAYVNYSYVAGAPFKIAVACVIGGVTGLAGGFLAILLSSCDSVRSGGRSAP